MQWDLLMSAAPVRFVIVGSDCRELDVRPDIYQIFMQSYPLPVVHKTLRNDKLDFNEYNLFNFHHGFLFIIDFLLGKALRLSPIFVFHQSIFE